MCAGVPERVEGVADGGDRDPVVTRVEGRELTVPQLVETSNGDLGRSSTSSRG
jgi:hypothetical protein